MGVEYADGRMGRNLIVLVRAIREQVKGVLVDTRRGN